MTIARFEDVDGRLFSRNDVNGEVVYYLDQAYQQGFNGVIFGYSQGWNRENPGWLEYEEERVDGLLQGLQVIYRQNGSLEQVSQCKSNQLHGISKEYDERGSLQAVSVVSHGNHIWGLTRTPAGDFEQFKEKRHHSIPLPEDIQDLLDLSKSDLLNYPLVSHYGSLDKDLKQLERTDEGGKFPVAILSKEEVVRLGTSLEDELDFVGDDYEPCAFLVYEEDREKKFTGLAYDYDVEKGVLLWYAFYKDGQRNGQDVEFYPSGHLKSVTEMKEGLSWGEAVDYYETGQVKHRAQLVAGHTMTFTDYAEDGQILEEKLEPDDFDKRMALKFGGQVWETGAKGDKKSLWTRLKNIFGKSGE